MNAEIDDFVKDNASGVSPVISSGETFYAARIMDQANITDQRVKFY